MAPSGAPCIMPITGDSQGEGPSSELPGDAVESGGADAALDDLLGDGEGASCAVDDLSNERYGPSND